jgi:hypothetical protein
MSPRSLFLLPFCYLAADATARRQYSSEKKEKV